MYNRKAFFQQIRNSLFHRLSQSQVDGIGHLLTAWEEDYSQHPLQFLAYCLATTYHETARTMQPIRERGGKSYFNRYDPVLANTASRRRRAKKHGNTMRGDGYKYRGRGDVQLTWGDNYYRAGQALGIDLVNNPDLALQPDIAAKIMYEGMINGWFTGKTLANYIKPKRTNYHDSRRIINGTDCAALIAGYAKEFEFALEKAEQANVGVISMGLYDAQMVEVSKEHTTGKPLHKSTTNLAAVGQAVTAAGGILAYMENMNPWVAGVLIVAVTGFAAWIIRERYLKSHLDGT